MSDKSNLRDLAGQFSRAAKHAWASDDDLEIPRAFAAEMVAELAEAIADEVARIEELNRQTQAMVSVNRAVVDDRLELVDEDIRSLANHTKLPTPGE